MTTSADTEIKDFLIGLEKRLDEKINALDKKLDVLDKKIDALDKAFDKKIDALDKKIEIQATKIDSLNQRLDDIKEQVNKQDNRFLSLIGILATALLGILAKVAFFPPSFMR